MKIRFSDKIEYSYIEVVLRKQVIKEQFRRREKFELKIQTGSLKYKKDRTDSV